MRTNATLSVVTGKWLQKLTKKKVWHLVLGYIEIMMDSFSLLMSSSSNYMTLTKPICNKSKIISFTITEFAKRSIIYNK